MADLKFQDTNDTAWMNFDVLWVKGVEVDDVSLSSILSLAHDNESVGYGDADTVFAAEILPDAIAILTDTIIEMMELSTVSDESLGSTSEVLNLSNQFSVSLNEVGEVYGEVGITNEFGLSFSENPILVEAVISILGLMGVVSDNESVSEDSVSLSQENGLLIEGEGILDASILLRKELSFNVSDENSSAFAQLTIAQQTAINAVADALALAGVSLDTELEITSTRKSIRIYYELPDGRTFYVLLENRLFNIEDDVTVFPVTKEQLMEVSEEVRLSIVESENRIIDVPAENRIFTVPVSF